MKGRLCALLCFSLMACCLAAAPVAAAPSHEVIAVTLRQSIPAAAFTPHREQYDYENDGRYLIHKAGPEGWYLTAVRLPQGATITAMTFFWYDDSATLQAKARLQRTELGTGNYQELAYAESPLSALGYPSSSRDDTISYAAVDNLRYAYWVVLDLPPMPEVMAHGVVVEYTPAAVADAAVPLSAAAFVPYEDGYDYQNHGRYLKHLHGPGGSSANGWYMAPVRLPDGATITRFTLHYYDNTASAKVLARLQRTEFGQGNYQDLATAESSLAGKPGYSFTANPSIASAVVDNAKYGYWVVADLPATADAAICSAVVEYQSTGGATTLISSAAAPLKPHQDGYDLENHGRYLIHKGGPEGSYYAAVRLADGAVVSKVTFHWYDGSSTQRVVGRLRRTDYLRGNWVYMAKGESSLSDARGYGSSSVVSVDYPVIDNSHFGYYVAFDLPPSADVRACGVTIDIMQRVYLPLLVR